MTSSRVRDHKLAPDELAKAAELLGLSLSFPTLNAGWIVRKGSAVLFEARYPMVQHRLAVRCWLLGYAAAMGATV